MAKYTQTKINRLFEPDPTTPKLTLVRRAKPIPPRPPEARRFKELPYPVMMSPGQRINIYKEYKRQMKRLTESS